MAGTGTDRTGWRSKAHEIPPETLLTRDLIQVDRRLRQVSEAVYPDPGLPFELLLADGLPQVAQHTGPREVRVRLRASHEPDAHQNRPVAA